MARIILDFDGTVVEHKYPEMGVPVPHALRVVERLQKAGHKIVLSTYRANLNNGSLQQAIDYIHNNPDHKIVLDEILQEKHHIYEYAPDTWNKKDPDQIICIDDSGYDHPLIAATSHKGMMINWKQFEMDFEKMGLLIKEH